MPHRSRRRRTATAIALALLVAGCGVQSDASPRDLPETEQALDVADAAVNIDASGADRVYLIGPGEERLLRSVQRAATSAADLVEILLIGPNDDEIQAQFSSAIPSTTELLDTRTQGQILTVNLSADIIDLDTQNLTRAVAQIVYTATELDGVESVQIEVDGERLSAPTAGGATTTSPLRIYDFPGLVQTSQPAYPAAPVSGAA